MLILLLIFPMLLILSLLILTLFYFLGKKQSWENLTFQAFECGFKSYYFSRFSFSIQYFLVALIFLFLDLELCVIMPFFLEPQSNLMLMYTCMFILALLLYSLIEEWKEGKLEWMF